MYKFGRTSSKRLSTCHEDLQLIFNEAIKRTQIDFGISEGHRSVERQKALYAQGRTTEGDIVTYIDGVTKKGKHNYSPSLAVDVYAFVGGKANWDKDNLIYLGNLIKGIASELHFKGLVEHELEWGGDWKRFVDMPHFNLK